MSANDGSALQPTLERAKAALREALAEACNTDVERADTGELIRVEEMLAIANDAAKQAISVRRRLRSHEKPAEANQAGSSPETPDATVGPPPDAIRAEEHAREIEDASGLRWMVFAVYPSAAPDGRPTVRERFRHGWLSFDCGDQTRRVTPIPENWLSLPDEELVGLCERAEAAPRRSGHSGGTTSTGGAAGGVVA